MSASVKFSSLAPKIKNLIVAGGLTGFLFGMHFYTMRAVGGTDGLQVAIDKFLADMEAIDKFEEQKSKAEDVTGPLSKS